MRSISSSKVRPVPRQVKNPRLGLTHNLGGNAGTGISSCIIVGNEKG